SQNPDVRTAARPGHRPGHPGNVRERAARRPRRPVSGVAATRGPTVDHGELGHVDEQSQSAVLPAHPSRAEGARRTGRSMAAPGRSHGARARTGTDHVTRAGWNRVTGDFCGIIGRMRWHAGLPISGVVVSAALVAATAVQPGPDAVTRYHE